ncbi:UNVERIFIED_CONTAM: hypothetical protein PYX00_011275 [Menopon gallinae]|uniref:T-complex protein 1 subunit gamma n=1 Tax=Menopon gallinae TaxID=328185 RepID=A0AAW2H7E8_9NEOP
MQKMVITRIGSIELTNDGNAILREIDVAHPAAKSLLELAKTQDDEVGDGTTSVIVLAAELLQKMSGLLFGNVHPVRITQAMGRVLAHCLEHLRSLAVDVGRGEAERLAIVRASVGTKLCSVLGVRVDELALKAVKTVFSEEFGAKRVDLKSDMRVEKIVGSDFGACEVMDGVILNKNIIHAQMRRTIESPRILVLDVPLEYKKGESQTSYEFRDPAAFKRALEVEEEQIRQMCSRIAELSPDIVVTEKGISDLAMSILFANNITALRRLKKSETTRLVKACGGSVVSRLEELSPKVLGRNCGLFEYVKIGEEYFCKFSQCTKPKACSVVLRAPSKDLLDELERNFYDAVKVAKNVFLCPKMCPGGGSTEMALSLCLEKFGGTDVERAVAERAAEALQAIPDILARNSGHPSPLDLVAELEAKQRQNRFFGIDGVLGEVADMRGRVMEPMAVKAQMLKSAFEAASLILRVDGVIQSTRSK